MGGGGTSGGVVSGTGGGGRQAPYVPGENDRLSWLKEIDLAKFLKREMGARTPMLLFVYGSGMTKDCCAANFERALFRNEEIVELSRKFHCLKYNASGTPEGSLLEPYKLNPRKPAILLLDAEAGLLHLQQACANPPDYVKFMRQALQLNDVRASLFSKHMASYRAAHDLVVSKQYGKALKELNALRGRRDQIMGSVQVLVEADLAELSKAAEEMLSEAARLESENQLVGSMRLFKKVAEDFVSQPEIGQKAGREARRISGQLQRMGLPGA